MCRFWNENSSRSRSTDDYMTEVAQKESAAIRFAFITTVATEHQRKRGTRWGLQCALLWKVSILQFFFYKYS